LTAPLFTVGYERLSLPALIDALSAAGVTTLVDVRALANSRRAGFSKTILANTLSEAGIGYAHLKALGTPKEGRDANRSGDMARFWRIVDEALARPEAGLAMVDAKDLALKGRVCLFCLEHDPHHCHRLRVAERLAEGGAFEVVHLTGA
jgi:uncharacterized protein (DUF488 family)